ncbi:MAG: hypothetical protein OQJ98_00915 [Candidatus Pacebacteria bacterium]|nr:hypothetical protein [Candidatus Paceibacterota bacterium]
MLNDKEQNPEELFEEIIDESAKPLEEEAQKTESQTSDENNATQTR